MPRPEASAFVKTSMTAPDGYFAWEATGLRWLAAVTDGARVAPVLGVEPNRLLLERVSHAAPSRTAAEAFGRDLARTHAAGAPAYGVGPDGWEGHGWLGPATDLLPLLLGSYDRWGEMYAELRLLPIATEGERRGALTGEDVRDVERLAQRLRDDDGDLDTGEPPARLHGDLWSGNLLWSPDGVVLVDPAAHAGHRETDLAMLQMFGSPQLATVLAAYDEAAPLADGWRSRVALHQTYPLLLHAAVFGGTYVGQAMDAVRRYL
ncbi:fructosamine kinase family protein [Luteipulveratus flavus]|uniref:Fructosamine kinase family protein n=1 Tax=Luteipulveratus flavus TaxID=3031728 RepID=A0ABT6CB57_9MICO|nr:fructosamine kinase family protein [Luteipulveratus sp. YIM 133296]MDF8265986.1 fructosamine kinase family protein [Luteipulveratus sp. YIM 133296]